MADLSAQQLIARADKEALAAPTLIIRGDLTTDSRVGTSTVLFKGADASGTIVLGDVEMTIVAVDGTAWFQGNDAWLAREESRVPGIRARIGDHWILADPGNPHLKLIADYVSRARVLKRMLTTHGTVRKTAAKTVDGIDCIGLDDGEEILYVDAVTGRPVSDEAEDGTEDATYTYGAVAEPSAPDPSDVVVVRDRALAV